MGRLQDTQDPQALLEADPVVADRSGEHDVREALDTSAEGHRVVHATLLPGAHWTMAETQRPDGTWNSSPCHGHWTISPSCTQPSRQAPASSGSHSSVPVSRCAAQSGPSWCGQRFGSP